MKEARRCSVFFQRPYFAVHCSVLLLAICACARADILILDDGSQLEGKAHKVGDQWVVTDAAGHETSVAVDRVTSFEFKGGSGGGAADSPATRLASLRQAVDHLSDLHQIIQRYNNFLATPENAPAEADARIDLSMWQRRADDGYIKVGGRWLTAMEREELASTEATTAAAIGQLIHEQNIPQAQDALAHALSDDPDDPAALYLQGLLLTQQGNIPAARADFEHVEKTVQGHAPTYNNLAVVLYRQHQYGAALNAYSQAMIASPANKVVLDNVIEALHLLPKEYQGTPPANKAAALLAEQDKELSKAQNADGLYRWGSGWVKADQLAKLTAEDETIKSQLAALQSDYDKTQASIASDDDQIARTQQIWNAYNQTNYYNGNNTTTAALPQDYYQIQQDLSFLQSARNVSIKRLGELKSQADRVAQGYSVPKYSGTLNLIGTEGTPIRTDQAAPSTQPGPG